MNKEQVDKLLELYEQGLTTSEEEAVLLKELGDSKTGANVVFNYIKHHKKQGPNDLEDKIWSSIQSGGKKKRRSIYSITSVAASVVLIVSLLLVNPFNRQEMSSENKSAIYDEALAMISESEEIPAVREVLYEDESIILYTE